MHPVESRIRYLGIVTDQPDALSHFYQTYFGLKELATSPAGDVSLTEGSFNLSLLKNTRITESKTFQFRAEAINAMNHVMFVNPNTTPSSSAFGTITDEKSTGRAIQLGFKFLF